MITTYKTEELSIATNEDNLFSVILPAENCDIFKGGWQPEEIKNITVIFRKPDALKLEPIKNGKLVAVAIDGEQTARLVYYNCNGSGEIVLTDTKSYVYPYDRGEAPIVMSVEESATRLNILGIAEKYYVTIKGAKQ